MDVRVKDLQSVNTIREREAGELREKAAAAEAELETLRDENKRLQEFSKNTEASAADHNDMIGQQIAALKEAAKLAHTEASKAKAECTAAKDEAAHDRTRFAQEKERSGLFQKQFLEAQGKVEAAEEKAQTESAKLQVTLIAPSHFRALSRCDAVH